jgi:membrane protein
MKRYLNWVLAALGAATAIAALRSRDESPTPVSSNRIPPQADPEASPPWFAEPLSVAKAVLARMRDHNLTMIAASLSYYAFLAAFPAAIAAISIYGLVLDPSDLTAQIREISEALPKSTADFISDQLTSLVESSQSGLGIAAVISIIFALWSASAGTKALITGIDIAYETPENRPFIVLRGIALAITFGLIIFIVAAASTVTFLPDLMGAVGAGDATTRLIEIGRWPLILIAVIAGLGFLYKIAPNRPASQSPWVSLGSLVVAILWVLATLGFSLYVNNLGNFGATYGALAGIIVLLLWFFLSGLIVLLGAELNAELEARDLARRAVREALGTA